jgi:F-type H+-transporting ATPase subunit delta
MNTGASEVTDGIIAYLKKAKLEGLLPEIVAGLAKKVAAGKTAALVETATEMAAGEKAEIAEMIRQKWPETGNVEFATNPDLVGGMKVSLGDRVLDLSVKARLEDIYEQI